MLRNLKLSYWTLLGALPPNPHFSPKGQGRGAVSLPPCHALAYFCHRFELLLGVKGTLRRAFIFFSTRYALKKNKPPALDFGNERKSKKARIMRASLVFGVGVALLIGKATLNNFVTLNPSQKRDQWLNLSQGRHCVIVA